MEERGSELLFVFLCLSSVFLLSLFRQSSHLSSGLPRFLQPSCFFVSDIIGNLLSFILTMCSANFIGCITRVNQLSIFDAVAKREWLIARETETQCPTGRCELDHCQPSTRLSTVLTRISDGDSAHDVDVAWFIPP